MEKLSAVKKQEQVVIDKGCYRQQRLACVKAIYR
jgi:hypothetical protein